MMQLHRLTMFRICLIRVRFGECVGQGKLSNTFQGMIINTSIMWSGIIQQKQHIALVLQKWQQEGPYSIGVCDTVQYSSKLRNQELYHMATYTMIPKC